MHLNPANCWDCPVSFSGAVFNAGVALLALWLGLALRRRRHQFFRWLGIPLLAACGLAYFVLAFSVWRFTIEWPWMQPGLAPPSRSFDTLFLAAILGLSTLVAWRARLLSRAREGT